jgi:hypothetical protein
VNVVLEPPPSPDPNSITVQGGDQALVVSWQKLDTAVYTNVLGYQILCNRGGDLQVFNTGAFTPGFTSVGSVAASGVMCPAAAGMTGIEGLDPAFVCSPLLTTSATSYRVKILQNDIVYGVGVVSVDNSSNASQPDIFYGTPIKTKSFYDVYATSRSCPGTASGGSARCPRARRGRRVAGCPRARDHRIVLAPRPEAKVRRAAVALTTMAGRAGAAVRAQSFGSQDRPRGGDRRAEPLKTPQHFAFELLGPYAGRRRRVRRCRHPYQTSTDRAHLMTQLEIDYEISIASARSASPSPSATSRCREPAGRERHRPAHATIRR